jgi:hypothetical protein
VNSSKRPECDKPQGNNSVRFARGIGEVYKLCPSLSDVMQIAPGQRYLRRYMAGYIEKAGVGEIFSVGE